MYALFDFFNYQKLTEEGRRCVVKMEAGCFIFLSLDFALVWQNTVTCLSNQRKSRSFSSNYLPKYMNLVASVFRHHKPVKQSKECGFVHRGIQRFRNVFIIMIEFVIGQIVLSNS